MTCDICGKEYKHGKGYKGERFKAEHFCSEQCYSERKPKSSKCAVRKPSVPPKPIGVNLPSEDINSSKKASQGSLRRKLTDYIQAWWPWEPNWQWIAKQIKDIGEEYELSYEDIYYVLKYCKEFENIELNPEYGLYQFFPRYIEPTQRFRESLANTKRIANELDLEDTYEVIKKKPSTRVWKER